MAASVALADFVKTSLRTFTATFAVKNERLAHNVPVKQMNFTRRVRSEAPRDGEEHAEKLRRSTRAAVMIEASLPDPQGSRYRAKHSRRMC